jgi:predicted nucleotidyltransferase
MNIENLSPKFRKALQRCLDLLTGGLRDNLYSVVLYGSAARGGLLKRQSDLNLLLVLNDSNPEAHRVIAEAISSPVSIRPMVICKKEMSRSFRAFAIKFESIRRNYILLHGQDPFLQIKPDTELLRFLTDQSLRNIRLRCIYMYVTRKDHRKLYLAYLIQTIPQLFTDLGTALRIEGIEVAQNYHDRLEVFRSAWGSEVDVLQDLLKLKEKPHQLSKHDIFVYHGRLFKLMDKVVLWLTR